MRDLIGNARDLATQFSGTFRTDGHSSRFMPRVDRDLIPIDVLEEDEWASSTENPQRFSVLDLSNEDVRSEASEDVGMGYVRIHAEQREQVYQLLRMGPANAIRLYRQALPLLESEEERKAGVHILALLTRSVRRLVRQGHYSYGIFATTPEGNWKKASSCLQALEWFAANTHAAKGCPFAKGILRALAGR